MYNSDPGGAPRISCPFLLWRGRGLGWAQFPAAEHSMWQFSRMMLCSRYFKSDYCKAPQQENSVSETLTASQKYFSLLPIKQPEELYLSLCTGSAGSTSAALPPAVPQGRWKEGRSCAPGCQELQAHLALREGIAKVWEEGAPWICAPAG